GVWVRRVVFSRLGDRHGEREAVAHDPGAEPGPVGAGDVEGRPAGLGAARTKNPGAAGRKERGAGGRRAEATSQAATPGNVQAITNGHVVVAERRGDRPGPARDEVPENRGRTVAADAGPVLQRRVDRLDHAGRGRRYARDSNDVERRVQSVRQQPPVAGVAEPDRTPADSRRAGTDRRE